MLSTNFGRVLSSNDHRNELRSPACADLLVAKQKCRSRQGLKKLKYAQLGNDQKELISKDVTRTFPNESFFQSAEGYRSFCSQAIVDFG